VLPAFARRSLVSARAYEEPYGAHNLTVYAIDVVGNTGASETISFSVAEEPFPVAPVAAASVAAIAMVVAVLLVYFKKRKH
jgi:hypothetical protein